MRLFAPTLAILMFCNWVASVVGFCWAMELFADFKIEMPLLTPLMVWATKGLPLLLGATFVAFSSVALARRTRIGWYFSFVICLMCDLLFLGFATWMNTLMDLGGNIQGVSLLGKVGIVISALSRVKLSAISESYEKGTLVLLATFMLTQVILGALTFGSRAWTNTARQGKV